MFRSGTTRAVEAVLLAAALTAAAVIGCSEGTLGPTKGFHLIAVGDTISGHLGGGERQIYLFKSYAESSYAVFLQSSSGYKQATVTDTSEKVVLAVVSATPGLALLQRGSGPFYCGNGLVEITVDGDGGDYRLFVYTVRRGPEERGALFQPGDTVTEALQTLADVDTFAFVGQAGQEVIAYLLALNDSPIGPVVLDIDHVAQVASVPGDSTLEQRATGRFLLSTSGEHTVTVQGAEDFTTGYRTYHGHYRFQVRAVQRAPERVPGTIAPGDSVTTEAIDYVGDVDAYALTGTPGTLVNVFLQARSALPWTKFFLRGTVGDSVVAAASTSSDTDLFMRFSGRLQLGGVGHDSIRVEGESDRALADRGPYGLFVYHVNPGPETAAPTLVAGDSVLTEAIDLPGDLDTFQLTVPESGLVNVVMQPTGNAPGGGVSLALEDPAGASLASLSAFVPGVAVASGAVAVPTGTYRLRVNTDPHSAFQGHYQVWTFAGFTSRPESSPDTIAIGDTIATEAISAPGDGDVFYLYSRRGDHVNIALQGQSAATAASGQFSAFFGEPGSGVYVFVFSPLVADSLGTYRSGRIDLPWTGWRAITIGGETDRAQIPAGAYRFAVTAWDTGPEHVSASLVPGDSVVAESLDYPGDWDEFTVTGPPGQLISIMTRLPQATAGYVHATVFDSVSMDTLTSVTMQEFDKATGRVAIPATGQLRVAVFEAPVGGFTGAYKFLVIPVNPAPENVPATFALGDTVRGEAIAPAMDLDEFTSTGTPGDTLAPFYRLTADPTPAGGLITLQVVDPTTGAVLLGSGASLSGSTPQFFSPGSFVVPAGGSYLLRVLAYESDDATAPYEFFVRKVP